MSRNYGQFTDKQKAYIERLAREAGFDRTLDAYDVARRHPAGRGMSRSKATRKLTRMDASEVIDDLLSGEMTP